MCGIIGMGFSSPDKTPDEIVLKKMCDIIQHRGPDGEGYYGGPGIGLGIRRLSIIDIETGNQPIFNEDQSLAVVCNGEIYNYVELRAVLVQKGHTFKTRSDVEVIVHLYEEEGVRCLEKLRGMFAFALWDKNRKQLFLARDRLGIKPLCYAQTKDGSLYFGSEYKSILTAVHLDRSIDPESLRDLFFFGYVVSPKTLFRKIKRLMPGHFLLYREGRVKIEEYWDLRFSGKEVGNRKKREEEWAEAVAAKFEESVRFHMRSDVPIAAWLSPGLDSSSVVSFMRRMKPEKLETFSIAFHDKRVDEVTHQKMLYSFPGYEVFNHQLECRRDSFELLKESAWHIEDPNASGIQIVHMMLAKETSKKFKVALTGEGADENFGGYPWYRFDTLLKLSSRLPVPIRRMMLLGPVIPKLRPGFAQLFLAPKSLGLERFARFTHACSDYNIDMFLAESLKTRGESPYPNHPAASKADNPAWTRFERLQYIDTKVRLTDFITHGLDRLSMSRSVEVRVPFLDHEFVELCAKIPPSLKLRHWKEKYIFRKAMQDHLPPEIAWRKKRGLMAPTSDWLSGRFSGYVEEMLSEKNLKDTGYFDAASVTKTLFDRRSGSPRSTWSLRVALMVVLSVQVWNDLFVRGCKP